MRSLVFSNVALKTLRSLPANTADLIVSKIELYASNPGALANNVKSLTSQPGRKRLRVGDWRVIFSEDRVVVAILRIAPRGSAYD